MADTKLNQEARRHLREDLLRQHQEIARRAQQLVADAAQAGDNETVWLMRNIVKGQADGRV